MEIQAIKKTQPVEKVHAIRATNAFSISMGLRPGSGGLPGMASQGSDSLTLSAGAAARPTATDLLEALLSATLPQQVDAAAQEVLSPVPPLFDAQGALGAAPPQQGTVQAQGDPLQGWEALSRLLVACGSKNDIVQDIDDFAFWKASALGAASVPQAVAALRQRIFERALARFSDGFAAQTGAFFKENGAAQVPSKMAQSIVEAVARRAQQIRRAANHLAGQVPESPSQTRRLLRGVRLRAPRAPEGLYSMRELRAVQRLVPELRAYGGPGGAAGPAIKNEELLGFEFGFLSLKARAAEAAAGPGEMGGAIREAVEGFLSAVARQTDRALSEKPRLYPVDNRGYAPLDRDAVRGAAEYVLADYARGGDAQRALREGAAFARRTYQEKAASRRFAPIYRYKGEDAFWNAFYLLEGQAQPRNRTVQRILRENWEAFMRGLRRGEGGLTLERAALGSGLLGALLPHGRRGGPSPVFLLPPALWLLGLLVVPILFSAPASLMQNPLFYGGAALAALVLGLLLAVRLLPAVKRRLKRRLGLLMVGTLYLFAAFSTLLLVLLLFW